ncbi:hypothetical protein AQJ46_42590 [Streptomyces canus]|uniref:Uncharacterized protein n=1 Tax=Streptomyces canus TaxID=58343 RepID=A0A101RP48_9ACTN|nr:hypothetical protein [Streptomyces canus]KUN58958.1 hypothetical protein AQJ46_42590 [Streptomyces canus]
MRPKRNLLRRWSPLAVAVLAPLLLFTGSGQASAAEVIVCLNNNGPDIRKAADTRFNRITKAVARQQAANTWQDWVWRGPEERCPWNAAANCSYTKAVSKTTSYQWSIGMTIGGEAKKEPFTAMASIVGGYNRSSSTTMTYTSGVFYKPGQFARPISVVERRWRSGDFVGAYINAPAQESRCPRSNVKAFRWDPNKRWGSWADNIKVRDYGTFHIHW